MSFCAWRNPEGVASPLADRKPIANPSQPLQGWDENKHAPFSQGFKANPGLELANAFSVTLATRRKQTCTLFPGFSKQTLGLELANAFSVTLATRRKQTCTLFPGFQSKPWAEISERFQRYACCL